jgi:hypothetical protein
MGIQDFILDVVSFLNSSIVPFLFAIAFLVFVWNAVRYFVIGGSNETEQEKARSLATWGLAAFIIMVSLWGIVNMFVSGFGIGRSRCIVPDYLREKSGVSDCIDTTQTDPGDGANLGPDWSQTDPGPGP